MERVLTDDERDERWNERHRSMQQLEPLPVETVEAIDDLNDVQPDLPDTLGEVPPAPKRTSFLGLGGLRDLFGQSRGHGAAWWLTRTHRYSSYAFTLYTAAHITSTAIIPLINRSVPPSEPSLLLFRPLYQGLLTEPLLVILPLATHILSGFALRLHRRNISISQYGVSDLPRNERSGAIRKRKIWPRVSWTSGAGYVAVPLVLGHSVINRLLPVLIHGDSSGIGLAFVSHGFAQHPFISVAGFTLLVSVTTFHVVWGWARWLGFWPVFGAGTAVDRKRKRTWWGINALSAAVAGLWLAGGIGVVGRGGKATGWIARQWDEIYAAVPLLGL